MNETWEYKVQTLPTMYAEAQKEVLNPLGKAGWELVSVCHSIGGQPVAYLKRLL